MPAAQAGGAFMEPQTTDDRRAAEQGAIDIERIHDLAESLLPHYALIAADNTLSDPQTNSRLQTLTGILHELHPADVADVLEQLPPKERVLVWRLAAPEEDGEVLLEVSDAVRETLIEAMNSEELLAAVEDLEADDLADLADDLPQDVVAEALQTRDEEERAQVQAAMSYRDDQVGAVMNFETVSIRADVSCEVVLRYLRRFDSLPDHTDKIFVVDDNDTLQGVLPIRKLLVSAPEEMVADVMATDVVRFRPEDDVEEAAQAFERYDLVTAPGRCRRQTGRPSDRGRNGGRDPRRIRSRHLEYGRFEGRRRPVCAGVGFGEKPLDVAGDQSGYRLCGQPRDRRL